MVGAYTCLNPVSWSAIGDRNTGSTTVMICFFNTPSTAVHFRNSSWFYWNFSVPSACSWAFNMLCGYLPELCVIANTNPVCVFYSSNVIVIARCWCRPPPNFNTTVTSFPLTNLCISISPSLVCSPPIFGRISVRKPSRTLSALLVALAISLCTLVRLDGRFIPWENSSNLLKSRRKWTICHWHVYFNVLLDKFMCTLGWYG